MSVAVSAIVTSVVTSMVTSIMTPLVTYIMTPMMTSMMPISLKYKSDHSNITKLNTLNLHECLGLASQSL